MVGLVGLGAGNIVLDADLAPAHKGHSPPPPKKNWPMSGCGQMAGCIEMPLASAQAALCYMGTKLPLPKVCPSFQLMSIVAKRSPTSATAEHL